MTSVLQHTRRLITLGYDSEMLRLGYSGLHTIRWAWFLALLAVFLPFASFGVYMLVSSGDGFCIGPLLLSPTFVLGWLLSKVAAPQIEEVQFEVHAREFRIIKRSLFGPTEQRECCPFSGIERVSIQFSDEETHYCPHVFYYYVGLGLAGAADPFYLSKYQALAEATMVADAIATYVGVSVVGPLLPLPAR